MEVRLQQRSFCWGREYLRIWPSAKCICPNVRDISKPYFKIVEAPPWEGVEQCILCVQCWGRSDMELPEWLSHASDSEAEAHRTDTSTASSSSGPVGP